MSGISNIGSSGEQHELAEYSDGLPNLAGAEALIAATIQDAARPGRTCSLSAISYWYGLFAKVH